MLPDILKKYFWDCEFDTLNMKEYGFFITEKILNYGNPETLKWLLDNINIEFLKDVVEKSRNLDKKTKNFWQLMLYE